MFSGGSTTSGGSCFRYVSWSIIIALSLIVIILMATGIKIVEDGKCDDTAQSNRDTVVGLGWFGIAVAGLVLGVMILRIILRVYEAKSGDDAKFHRPAPLKTVINKLSDLSGGLKILRWIVIFILALFTLIPSIIVHIWAKDEDTCQGISQGDRCALHALTPFTIALSVLAILYVIVRIIMKVYTGQ